MLLVFCLFGAFSFMMERKGLSCYLHTGYNIKFIQNYRNIKKYFSEIFNGLYLVYDISYKYPSFFEEKSFLQDVSCKVQVASLFN